MRHNPNAPISAGHNVCTAGLKFLYRRKLAFGCQGSARARTFCIADGDPPEAGVDGVGGDGAPAALWAATAVREAMLCRERHRSGDGGAQGEAGEVASRGRERDRAHLRPTPGHLVGGALGPMVTAGPPGPAKRLMIRLPQLARLAR